MGCLPLLYSFYLITPKYGGIFDSWKVTPIPRKKQVTHAMSINAFHHSMFPFAVHHLMFPFPQ